MTGKVCRFPVCRDRMKSVPITGMWQRRAFMNVIPLPDRIGDG